MCQHQFRLLTKKTMWHDYGKCFSCGKVVRSFKKSNDKKYKI